MWKVRSVCSRYHLVIGIWSKGMMADDSDKNLFIQFLRRLLTLMSAMSCDIIRCEMWYRLSLLVCLRITNLLCPIAVSCDTRITYPPGHAAGVSSALNPGTSLIYTRYESNTTRCRHDTIRPWSKRQSYKDRVLTVGHATTARWCHFPFPLLPFPSLVQEPLLTAIRNPRRSRPCSFIRHASISSIETLRE